jgi:tetratricopeptide (TPR) repeat protein
VFVSAPLVRFDAVFQLPLVRLCCTFILFLLKSLGKTHMARITTLSAASISPMSHDPKASFGLTHKGVFRKEGDYWRVGYDGTAVRLKDIRGFGYIAHLLRHPDTEFHVLDLYGGIASQREEEIIHTVNGSPRPDEDFEKAGMHIAGPGDAGEMLDPQAKLAYRRRLVELREELAEAKRLGKVERAEQAEQEMDALSRELSRAVGLGGRDRVAASASERARQSVTKSIRSTLDRIAQADVTLSELLSRGIKTGTFCSYRPAPDFSVAWEFAETTFEDVQLVTSSRPLRAAESHYRQLAPMLDISPFSIAERTPLVGREAERAAICTIIERALSGHGSLVLLGGGPGLGKSRLAMEMAEYASQLGFKCLVGHCYERNEPYPYLPFVEIIESALAQAPSLDDYRHRLGENAAELAQLAPSLRRIFGDIPEPLALPAAQQRFYLFRSLSEALARVAQTRSYLNILEDLHWADESTLALLVHLATRIARLPVVIIGTYRDTYSDSNPVLVRTLEELLRLGIRPLKLHGLPRAAVAEMLNALSQQQPPENLVNVMFDASQGNPFFIEELYRHLREENRLFNAAGQFRTDIMINEIDIPENVRLVIDRRLERLNDNERRVLAAAAVIGRSFSFQLLTEISQIDVDELFTVLEKAQLMGIIIPSAEGPERPFTFRHELVRHTLFASISAPRQQRLHVSVADAIEKLYPRALNERAGDIADHLLKAGSFADQQKLLHYLTHAGKAALRTAAFEEAGHSFGRALSLLTDADMKARADLLTSLAIAERGREQWDAAVANLGEAFEIYISLGDQQMIARSCTQLTGIFVWAGRLQEAIHTAFRGLSYLGSSVETVRARLLAAFAQAQATAGNWNPAQAAIDEAMSIASPLSEPKLVGRLLGARSTGNYQFLRLREAAADGQKARDTEAPPWERTIELQYLYQSLLFLGRLDDAAKVRDQLEPLATKIGQSYSILRCRLTRAWLEFGEAPDLAKLETVLQQVLESDPKAPPAFWEVFSEGQLCLVDFLGGNWKKALHHARASFRFEAENFLRGAGIGTFFRQLSYDGDRAAASALLRDKGSWLPRSGQPNPMGSWWLLANVIEGLVMLGEQSHAGQFYPLARELINTGAVVFWPIFRFTHTVAGIAASAAQNWDVAEQHFQTAMHQAEVIPHRLEQAEIHRFHAMMLMDRALPGDRTRVQTLLNAAIESYQHIGMPRHSEITKALLRQT